MNDLDNSHNPITYITEGVRNGKNHQQMALCLEIELIQNYYSTISALPPLIKNSPITDYWMDYDGLDNQAVVYTLNDHETKSDKLGKDEWHNQMFKTQSMMTFFGDKVDFPALHNK